MEKEGLTMKNFKELKGGAKKFIISRRIKQLLYFAFCFLYCYYGHLLI